MFQVEKLDSINSDVLTPSNCHVDLHGDMYLQDTNVNRLCALSWGGESSPYSNTDGCFLEETDAMRASSIAGLAVSNSVFGEVMKDVENWQRDPTQFHKYSMDDHFGQILGLPAMPLFQGASNSISFEQVFDPPPHLESKHFFDADTMVRIKTRSPWKLGNTILEFFETHVVASISKVNKRKYTIKAQAFVDDVMSCIKIKIWKSRSSSSILPPVLPRSLPPSIPPSLDEECIVQFLRKSGDPFTFGHLCAQACNFLKGRFPCYSVPEKFREVENFSPFPLPPAGSVEPLDGRDINPLLEMLNLPFANVQAEAASRLSEIAHEEPSAARFLCEPAAFKQIERSLSATHLSVTYPIARLLSVLVLQRDAEHPLAEQDLLKAMIEKIGHDQTEPIIRLELAKATSTAMRRCAPILSKERAEVLRRSLEQAIQDISQDCDSMHVKSSLEDALLEVPRF